MANKIIDENRINEIVDEVINKHLSAMAEGSHLAHDDEALNEMANLYLRRTGINTRIYISSREGGAGPRIKVYNSSNDESFSMSIEDAPKVLIGNPDIVSNKVFRQVIRWIQINKEVLLYYWQHPEMDIDELLGKIKKAE